MHTVFVMTTYLQTHTRKDKKQHRWGVEKDKIMESAPHVHDKASIKKPCTFRDTMACAQEQVQKLAYIISQVLTISVVTKAQV